MGHCVETWFAFFGKQHLVHKAFKLCTSIAKEPRLIFIQITYAPMGLQNLSADRLVLVFENALVKMSGNVANIIHVAQVT